MNPDGGVAKVVPLKTYALAHRAAVALRGLLHEPAWLVAVKVEFLPSGGPEVVVVVTSAAPYVALCLPRSVDDVPVRIRGPASGKTGKGSLR
jgi:hypothetical protein